MKLELTTSRLTQRERDESGETQSERKMDLDEANRKIKKQRKLVAR